MVPRTSRKVPRVSRYSGSRHVCFPFVYGTFTLSGLLSQNRSTRITESIMRSEPRSARTPVWPLSISLAATLEIEFSFFSSPYLDVSVQAVPDVTLWIHVTTTEVCSARFPHSDISGSMDICSSPKLFAAYHVFHRLLVPRHPPCALYSITKRNQKLFLRVLLLSTIYSVISLGLGHCLMLSHNELLQFFRLHLAMQHLGCLK